jgi:hypothetical protein
LDAVDSVGLSNADAMSRFGHPIRAKEMQESPEFRLRAPGEVADHVGTCADEGAGTGYDNAFPWAYVERHFELEDGAPDPVDWFDDRLRALGWRPMERNHRSMVTWRRDLDETITLTSWGRPPRRVPARFRTVAKMLGVDKEPPDFRRSFRLSFQIDGRWPDGSKEPRFE